MRNLAVAVAAALVFALVAPAFAQPFADVPPTHWAYDALAELAAKGLMEGYPDGTFKGDRAMTRYEMAMVVARLLARIESIQIPAAPPAPGRPEVTRTDVASIQRLVNEFRAELAALGVRVTAIEEELNAIKSKLSNVRLTGAFRFRYDERRNATGGAIVGNGNPQTANIDSSNSATVNRARENFKLVFDGAVAPDVHLIGALLTRGSGATSYAVFNSSQFGAASQFNLASIDNLFFDWKNMFGWPLEVWIGRFGGSGLGFGSHPVQFGPFGLLMNTAGDTWEDSTGDSGFNVADGIRLAGHWADLADLQVQATAIRIIGGTGTTTYFSGEDALGVDANIGLPGFAGLRVGGYYVWNYITANPAQPAGALTSNYHVYGPGGGSWNPATVRCPATANGITCPALGTGFGGYLQWDVFTGIHLDGEYAQWTDSVFNTSDTGYQANVSVDLGSMTGWGHNLSVSAGYLNFGANFYPPYGAAEADTCCEDQLYPGNAQGFTVQASFDPIQDWNVYGVYFSGNHVSNGQSLTAYEAGVVYKFAPRAKITFKVRDTKIASIDQSLLYRAQLDYSF